MPNHWHALIYPAYPLTISKVLHDAKKIAMLRLHAVRHNHGPFWQHQFWDRFARHAREFRQRLDYMHQNPVKAGLVKRPEEWRWSSYNNFALDKTTVAACPIQRVAHSFAFQKLCGSSASFQIRLRSSLGIIILSTGIGLPFPEGAFTVPV